MLLCLQKKLFVQAANIGLQSGHYTADVCRYAESKFLQIVEFLPAWRQCEDLITSAM